MASSGSEWAELIAIHNSGTYCNQYMVVDLKLYSPGEELQPGLLWVIEQVSPPSHTLIVLNRTCDFMPRLYILLVEASNRLCCCQQTPDFNFLQDKN